MQLCFHVVALTRLNAVECLRIRSLENLLRLTFTGCIVTDFTCPGNTVATRCMLGLTSVPFDPEQGGQ